MAGGSERRAGAPVLEEQLDHLDVPVVRGGHERRLVEAVAHVHVLRVPGAQRPAQRVCTKESISCNGTFHVLYIRVCDSRIQTIRSRVRIYECE